MNSNRRTNAAPEILLVEDSPTQAAQLQHLLESQGYAVRVAANGNAALAAMRKRKPSIVISDIVMPKMDGYTLCQEVKSRRSLREVPFVLLTALSEPKDVIRALQCGADSFIKKPYEENTLLARVKYILTTREIRKSEKVQMGLEVFLGGERHFITSERQQIMDMLISTYEEAVRLNTDLEGREKELRRSYHTLHGLYRISEGLNQSTSEQEVLAKALERALELPGIQSGWISLRTDESGFRITATRDLPPALTTPGAFEGDCLCRRKLLSGELDQAANILECERLQKAADGTNGLRYHASVPLRTAGETLGLLNLAGAGQGLFNDEDLKTLHAVGQQIGSAIERARLYEQLEKKVEERTAALTAEIAERKRAQEETRRNLERIRALHEIDLAITSTLDLQAVLYVLLENIDRFLPYPSVSGIRLLSKETGLLDTVASKNVGLDEWKSAMLRSRVDFGKEIMEKMAPLIIADVRTDPRTRQISFFRKHGLVSLLGVPMLAKDQFLGTLSYYTKEPHEFSEEEIEFLSTLAGQASIAIYNAQLYEQIRKQSVELLQLNEELKDREGIQRLLKELHQDITSMDLKRLLQKLTDKARGFLNADICDIRIKELGVTRVIVASGIDPEKLSSTPGLEQPRLRTYAQTREPIRVSDLSTDRARVTEGSAALHLGARGYLGAPFFARDGSSLGIMRVLTYQPRDFRQEEADLLQQLANGAAIAIENTRLYSDLEKSNNVKSEFLNVMSHELRTPLNVIMGYVAIMRDSILGAITSEQQDALTKVARQTQELLTLLTSIMEATKIESGTAVVENHPVELARFLDELRRSYNLPFDKEVTLTCDCPLDPATVTVDGGKLQIILQNLINNAVKFTEKGTVTIAARVIPDASFEHRDPSPTPPPPTHESTINYGRPKSDFALYVQFKVSDTGIGIAQEELPMIFDMFHQVNSSSTRPYSGVGLGLYLVKKFTELLAGRIEVASQLGKGSTFTVTIPVAHAS